MATKKLQILGTLGNNIYVQNEEPENAPENAIWLDLDAPGHITPELVEAEIQRMADKELEAILNGEY